VNAAKVDLFHSPFFLAPWKVECPVLVTVHDLMALEMPDFFDDSHPLVAWYKRLFHRRYVPHSLEVAEVGKRIARMASWQLLKKSELPEELQIPFVQFVETACLMHDLGNPPFGHFGETAIQEWFRDNGMDTFKKSYGIPKHIFSSDEQDPIALCLKDFEQFDGNPQGFRIVTKLQSIGDDSDSGLNLTHTQLLSSMKYTRCTDEKKTSVGHQKKAGFFQTERDRVNEACDSIAWPNECRFPLAYLMEAADDIAYCLSDIDDGIEKRLVAANELIAFLEKNRFKTDYIKNLIDKYVSNTTDTNRAFLNFKTRLTEHLINHAAQAYVDGHKAYLSGAAGEIFAPELDETLVLRSMKDYAREHLFRSDEVERLELTGYHVIFGLLNVYKRLLECSFENFQMLVTREPKRIQGAGLDIEWRLYNRLPEKYVRCYVQMKKSVSTSLQEWPLRAHLVVDYISGMTDQFALTTFRELTGISLF